MLNFFQIARNTFRECIREPIFFILLVTALVLIGHFPSVSLFVFSEQLKLVVDSSMATSMVFGLFAAVLCAGHTVSREMRNGTVLLLMSKPVERWSFIMAKICGTTAASILFIFLCNTATIISVYIAKDQFRFDMTIYFIYFGILIACSLLGMIMNYLKSMPFPSVSFFALLITMPLFLVGVYFFAEHPEMSLMNLSRALFLLFFCIIVMSTMTVVFSTRLDMVPNLVVCSLIFFLGLLSNYLFQDIATGSPLLALFSYICYAILPNWQFFWMADALAGNQIIPTSYLAWGAIYTLFYTVFCSIWAVALFMSCELAKDSR
ncbi:MAG: hypothetical protein PHV75_03295 [Victivallaceae bacterium]|jgi:ABC-type transport system involved in multi-copper enzyme maturation permease subunit|nr:hypothetical protein [Victivallaceae bacterium]NLK83269.1 hypothetical protein [Lentisphaerota bacterium]MDD3115837.1 hypothetical protein [Victivallaceae bacterium]MDD3702734.1 hypothetical protein [Victivallaceae bacterium]MDD4317521.1 hypothetical protein [Victivallaceae bacterium]